MIARVGSMRVTRAEWYAAGGFSNPRCWRRADSAGVWHYYITRD